MLISVIQFLYFQLLIEQGSCWQKGKHPEKLLQHAMTLYASFLKTGIVCVLVNSALNDLAFTVLVVLLIIRYIGWQLLLIRKYV